MCSIFIEQTTTATTILMEKSKLSKPTQEKCKEETLIVRNLDPNVTTFDLRLEFGRFGCINGIIPSLDDRDLGRATIQFADGKRALLALKYLNNTKLETRYIQIFRRGEPEKGLVCAIVKLTDLSPKLTQRDLEKMLRPYGEIMWSFLAVDKYGQSKKWGLVQFFNKYHAWKCVDTWSHPTIVTDIFDSERVRRSVFLSKIPITTKELEIRKVVAQFGEIKNVHMGQTGQNSKYLFITMSNWKEADKVVKALHEKEKVFENQILPIFCRRCRRDISKWKTQEEDEEDSF